MGSAKRWLVVAALVVAVTGGCGDDGDDGGESGDTTTTTEETTSTLDPAAEEEAKAEITSTVEALFDGSTPIEQRVQYLEDGEELADLVEQQFSILGEQATQTTAQVKEITIVDDSTAEFVFDVLLSGAPVVPDYPGLAVVVEDEWKVSKVTLCDLLRLANNQPRECQNLGG
jgi:exonuclease VII small subunit